MNKSNTPKVSFGSPDRTLQIAGKNIQCYVLDDETRVLTQASFLESLGRHRKANVRKEMAEEPLPPILQGKAINRFISQELLEKSKPIHFRTKTGAIASGYRAEVLPMVCEVYLKARDAGVLPPNQKHVAQQADLLIRALAHVGIIALVDEVTGYQEVRSRQALEEILERFISKELRKWAKTFPDEFYQNMFRLRDWQYVPFSVKRPGVIGKFTNDLVYERLAPGVLEELKRVTPRDEKGRTKHRYFQRLTEDVGHPRLREHLTAVIALMRASTKWDQFYRMLQRALPRYMEQVPLDIGEPEDK